MNFIDWYSKLATNQDETVLIVQQKKNQDNSAWVAMLPSRWHPALPSVYGNTGLFRVDRFERGRPSASRACVDRCAVLVLDDIGTKSAAPALAPTWRMETSPGNFQWGFALSPPAPAAHFEAAVRAIAEAGYTDKAACNAVRNWRLPGSKSLKETSSGQFEAVLAEFAPEVSYSLDDICAALGLCVTVDSDDDARLGRVTTVGVEADPVWCWLVEQGLAISRPNADGWAGIVCPNAASHTTGTEARYAPGACAFHCFHEHCLSLDSRAFLAWVASQGGPVAEAGIRADLLVTQLRAALAALQPTAAFPESATAVVEEVERRERGRLDRAGWYERFAFVESANSFFDLVDRREISRGTFDALFRHISCRSVRHGRIIEASVAFDENRQAAKSHTLAGITYAPGEDVLCARDGFAYGNVWSDARQPGVTGDVGLWLEHAERLLPERSEREHVLDVLAYKLQNPRVKINHAILHAGTQGAGKDSLYAPFLYALGGAQRNGNVSIVDGDAINSQFQYWLFAEVIVLNELREVDGHQRRALAHRLKPVIAAPPAFLSVNRKNLTPVEVPNRSLVLAFSNEAVPIQLDSSDRRWFCVKSRASRMEDDVAAELWTWYENGGFDAVAAWLHARDVRAFNPGATPFMTEYKAALIGASMGMSESYLLEMILARVGEFASGVVLAPWQAFCDRLQGSVITAAGSARLYPAMLLHALQEAGWIDCGMVKTLDYPTKRHLYCAPGLETKTKADLRRIGEGKPDGKLAAIGR